MSRFGTAAEKREDVLRASNVVSESINGLVLAKNMCFVSR